MMLRRYTDATRTFVTILNLILRMRQYHTRSYQYDQINKTADRMYALFAICNALSPNRLDDNILNIVKERFSEQVGKMSRGEEGVPAFEELFTYACPKFVSANPPPYEDAEALAAYLEDSHVDPAQRHLKSFIADVRTQLSVPTLRSFLKLYTSLGTSKLAGFLDTDEEEMVQQLMVLKQASRSIGRVGNEKGLLEGSTISNNDLDFVIDEVMSRPALHRRSGSFSLTIGRLQNMVHITESIVGRRYAGWFIRNGEHAQRVYDGLKNSPLPVPIKPVNAPPQQQSGHSQQPQSSAPVKTVAWGGVKTVG